MTNGIIFVILFAYCLWGIWDQISFEFPASNIAGGAILAIFMFVAMTALTQ